MSINLGTAIAYLDLDSKKFRDELKKTQSLMQTLQNNSVSLGTKIDAVGQTFVSAGTKMTLGLTAPLLAVERLPQKVQSNLKVLLLVSKKLLMQPKANMLH